MNAAAAWKIDQTMILSAVEIATVLDDLRKKAKRSVNTRQNRVILRLATCCGLRVSELCGLTLRDVRVGMDRPYINIRKALAKGKKARRVPLWWDRATLADLEAWKAFRQDEQGAGPGDRFVCAQRVDKVGALLDRRNARMRFKACCRCLGEVRVKEITIHHGRHSFISHALKGGRSLAEVRDAAGHASIATTSIYTHVVADDDGEVGDLFDFSAG